MTIGRSTLSDQIVREIISEIKQRDLQAGDEVPAEGELAERHGVNRLVIREAIRTLVARGVLVSSQGKRARVAVPSPAVLEQILEFRLNQNSMDLRDLIDTRQVIEGALARRAASRVAAGHGTVDEAEQALAAMHDHTGDPDGFIAADLAFHQAVADLANSNVLSFILSAMNGVLLDVRRTSFQGREQRGSSHGETIDAHREILDTVVAGDPDAAAEAMSRHLTETSHDLGL
ncbi:FadR/GntR family transcriptional regulator [Streptomyces sp. NBC_01465]|uniref:FadR/GntR family transcriptional regulator n=1 Tax=Streptomyces sp. NBC_01465 TaxID=2903878 RepID=UPI002E307355|nr:FCD domain-containing protein [Streptomyces sp. NBC_01465]